MRFPLPTGRPFPPLARLALLLLLAGSCSDSCSEHRVVFEGTSNDLLRRTPDVIHDQPGLLLPAADDAWGANGREGWFRMTLPEAATGATRDAGVRLYVRTEQPRAVLRLPATTPRTRTIELEIWSPDATDDARPKVRVQLNGIGMWELALAPEPTTVEIEVHEAAWRSGDNLLSFEVDAVGNMWPIVHIASVRYDDARQVIIDTQAATARLEPDTGVGYAIELRDRTQLQIEAQCRSQGELRVRYEPLDGAESSDRRFEETLLVSGGEQKLSVALPPLSDIGGRTAFDSEVRPIRITLSWTGSTDALELTRLVAREESQTPRPSVVFISIDTFAARHLSTYGYGRETTPNLNALAEEALLFERCYVNAPWTMPSYMSVMTGLYPQAHKLEIKQRANSDALAAFSSWRLADERWTMAESFRGLGYRTGGFIDTHWLLPLFSMDQGFDTYDIESALIGPAEPDGGVKLIHHKLETQWLDAGSPEQPFFLFLHALDAHGPYLHQEEFLDTFQRAPPPEGWDDVPAGSAFQTYGAIPYWMGATLTLDPLKIPEHTPVEPIVDRYDETLLKTDHYLGRIFDALRERDLYDDALIIVTGDHGESFDHEFYGHGTMWEDVLLVPLIIKFPDGEHGGRRLDTPVQLTDLYPTLRDQLGLATLPGVHGQSLLDLIEAGPFEESRVLYGSEGHCEQYFVSDGRWKLVVEHPGRQSQFTSLLTHPEAKAWFAEHYPELVDLPLTPKRFAAIAALPEFQQQMAELRGLLDGPFQRLVDLHADPDERINLAGEHPEIVERLMKALEHERKREEDARVSGLSAVSTSDLDVEALRALGYVGEE